MSYVDNQMRPMAVRPDQTSDSTKIFIGNMGFKQNHPYPLQLRLESGTGEEYKCVYTGLSKKGAIQLAQEILKYFAE